MADLNTTEPFGHASTNTRELTQTEWDNGIQPRALLDSEQMNAILGAVSGSSSNVASKYYNITIKTQEQFNAYFSADNAENRKTTDRVFIYPEAENKNYTANNANMINDNVEEIYCFGDFAITYDANISINKIFFNAEIVKNLKFSGAMLTSNDTAEITIIRAKEVINCELYINTTNLTSNINQLSIFNNFVNSGIIISNTKISISGTSIRSCQIVMIEELKDHVTFDNCEILKSGRVYFCAYSNITTPYVRESIFLKNTYYEFSDCDDDTLYPLSIISKYTQSGYTSYVKIRSTNCTFICTDSTETIIKPHTEMIEISAENCYSNIGILAIIGDVSSSATIRSYLGAEFPPYFTITGWESVNTINYSLHEDGTVWIPSKILVTSGSSTPNAVPVRLNTFKNISWQQVETSGYYHNNK